MLYYGPLCSGALPTLTCPLSDVHSLPTGLGTWTQSHIHAIRNVTIMVLPQATRSKLLIITAIITIIAMIMSRVMHFGSVLTKGL
jgi:hypothetical protein